MLKTLPVLFGGKQKSRILKLRDDVLGELRLSEESNWWEASVLIDDKNIGFKIGGDSEPDRLLIAHAHDIVHTFPDFERTLSLFLAEEARRIQLTQDQIRQLKIEDVMLCWPDRPDDGMIYFSGLANIGVWRCDYVDRKPKGLGFDS